MLWPDGLKTRPNISSPFGWRIHPITGRRTLHAGVDLTGYGTVRAIAAGTVTAVGTPPGWSDGGVQVWVQHDGFLTRSMHMAAGSPVVRVGQKVAEGQALGTMGMTGGATGVHHHLEVVVNGAQIDPVPFITARLGSTAGGGIAPAPETLEDIVTAHVQLYLYTPNNNLLLVDHLNKTIRELGNRANFERSQFDSLPHTKIAEPLWTQTFRTFAYVTKPNLAPGVA